MSDDLVKRLRDMSNYYNSGGRFVAADRIEELEAKLAEADRALDISCVIIEKLMEDKGDE